MNVISRSRDLLEMIRFSHTVFALPFALLAAVMAWTAKSAAGQTIEFSWVRLVGILICMVGARSAAMAFNRLVDRKIDAGNPRTAQRHIPAGRISVTAAIVFFLLSTALFVGGTLLFLPNWLPLVLSGPVLLVLLVYSYTKRFTSLAHFWLGFSLMLAPVATWIALRGEIVLATPLDLVPAIGLGAAVLLWVSGFDIIYACQDFEFDRESGLKSVPTRLGIRGALRVASVCHLVMIIILISLPFLANASGVQLGLGALYWAAVVLIAALLLYEHLLVKADDLARVNVAFFNVNAIVSFGLFLAGSIDLLWV